MLLWFISYELLEVVHDEMKVVYSVFCKITFPFSSKGIFSHSPFIS